MMKERSSEKPSRLFTIGICPECSYREIQAVYEVKVYKDISGWDGDNPDRTHESWKDDEEFAAYYCPSCQAYFQDPDFIQVRE
jgi:hypothetical protein